MRPLRPAISLLCTLAASSHAQLTTLGAMGDSLTDEYAEESYSYAHNWLEQLHTFRNIDLGPTAADQPNGTWGEPRRRFFEYNWARAGASTVAVITGGQAAGLASQYSSGVTHAVLLVGSNDFAPNSTAFTNIYNNTWTQAQIDNYIATRLSNMATIINTATASGTRLAVSTFLDYSIALSARKQYPDPIKRERVSAVVRRVNLGIRDLCRARRLPLVDIYGIFSAIFGTNDNIHDTLRIGGQTISLNVADSPTNSNPLAGLCHDGVHPHTTLQAIFANYFITAANIAWNAQIPTFTEQEILQHAGLPYLGPDQLPDQLGDYATLITNFACPADFDKSGFVDVDDYIAFIHAFEQGDPTADLNGSGQVDLEDFSAFVQEFETGC